MRSETRLFLVSPTICAHFRMLWSTNSDLQRNTRYQAPRISQYADENTCFVSKDCGLLKVLDVFEKYGRASGAKLNRTKSKGLWLGRWRQRSDSPGGLMWSDSTIKIVGFHFGDMSAAHKTWDTGVAKFCKVLSEWQSRFLTLHGKCTVLRSLAASSIRHLVRIYPPERAVIDRLKTAMWKFIWSNKPELVRREVLYFCHHVWWLKCNRHRSAEQVSVDSACIQIS